MTKGRRIRIEKESSTQMKKISPETGRMCFAEPVYIVRCVYMVYIYVYISQYKDPWGTWKESTLISDRRGMVWGVL